MAPRSRLFSGVPAALATIGLCACAGESTPEPRRERVQGEIGRPTNSLYADFAESRISGGPDGYAALDALPAAPGDGLRFDELSSYLGLYDVVPGWGLSWTDFDLDGDPDLFVADHMHYPSALYVNEGGLRFRKLEGSLGHDIYLDDHMGVWADFDGDALPDLYTANGFYRPDHLMRNAGDGRFQDVAAETGLSVDESGRGRSALWADFDGDGWNDLLVLNLRTPDYYYRNAAGRFEDATERSGMSNAFSKEGAVSGDLDGDLDLDVFLPVLRRGVPNVVWLNRGDGSFRAVDGGRASQEGGSHAAAMGDYDNDGDLDLYVAAHQDSPGALLRNRGDGSFEDVTAEAGITLESSGGRSAAFVDLDNDGWLDLFVACGGGLDGPSRANALYRNRGNGRFENVAGEAGLRGLSNGRTASAAFADYNLDGYLDIAVTNGGDALAISGQHLLYRNAGGTSRWLWVHAPAAPGNLDGIGAEVRLTLADGRVRVRRAGLVQTMGQNEPGAHFGLGEATGAAEVAVRWPSGREARVQGVPAGQRIVVRRPSESSYLRAHPAALVGDTHRGALEALLAHLGGALEPAPPTDPEVQSRLDELLAWKTTTDAAAQLEVPSAALDAAWSEEEQRFQLPRRMWLEQVAIGPFTMRDKPPKLHWDLAESVYEELVAGGDVLEVAERHGVRAWARVYKKGGSYAPNLGAEDESVRGYVEAGWLTPGHDLGALRRRCRSTPPSGAGGSLRTAAAPRRAGRPGPGEGVAGASCLPRGGRGGRAFRAAQRRGGGSPSRGAPARAAPRAPGAQGGAPCLCHGFRRGALDRGRGVPGRSAGCRGPRARPAGRPDDSPSLGPDHPGGRRGPRAARPHRRRDSHRAGGRGLRRRAPGSLDAAAARPRQLPVLRGCCPGGAGARAPALGSGPGRGARRARDPVAADPLRPDQRPVFGGPAAQRGDRPAHAGRGGGGAAVRHSRGAAVPALPVPGRSLPGGPGGAPAGGARC